MKKVTRGRGRPRRKVPLSPETPSQTKGYHKQTEEEKQSEDDKATTEKKKKSIISNKSISLLMERKFRTNTGTTKHLFELFFTHKELRQL